MSLSEPNLGSPGSRLRDLRKKLKLSQGILADQIEISQSTLSQIENDHYTLSLAALAALEEQHGVNCNWLISGKGEVFLSNSTSATRSDGFTGAVLPIVNVFAHAGLPEDRQREDDIMEVGHYVLPGFINTSKQYRIFPVEGQSMEPTLYEGDFAICVRLSDKLQSIKEGSVVVVDTKVGVIIKRYYKHDDEDLYLLDSDNPDYKPEILQREDIRQAWHVEGVLTRQLGQVGALPNNRLQRIEQELAELKQLLARLADS